MSEQFLSDADFFGSEPLLSDDDFFGSEPAAAASGGDVPGLAEYQEKPLLDRAGAQLESGWETLKQAGQATFAKSGMTSLQVMDRIDRGEPVTMMEDPAGYADMSPEDRAALRQQSAQGVAMNLGRMAASAETQANLPRNPAADALVQRANAGDWSGAWNAFTADPLGVAQQFSLESLPLAAPGLVAGVATAPIGGLAAFLTGLAAGSYPVEYGASLLESLRDAGVDIRDTAAVQAKLSDPVFMKEIGERANTRGTVIAAADAAGGALAAPLRAGQAIRNAGIAARNIGAEVGTEMAGEAAAQVASGEEFKAGEVLAEGLGAGPQSVVTTAGRTIAANRAAPAEPVAPPPERIEPYFEAAPGRRATISADDDASPLPNDFIARGKAIIEDTLAGRVEPPALSFDAENTQEPPAQIPQGAVPAETLIGAEPETLLSDEDFFGSAEPVTPAETFLTDEDIFGPAEGLKPLYGETGQQTGWVNPATGEEQALTSAAGNGEPRVNRGGLAPDGPLPSLEVPQPAAGEMNVGGAGPSVEPIGDGSQASPVVVQTADDIARAESQVAEPTEAQKESGNYRKAHLKLAGLDISIENPKDSIRSGTAPDGTTWQTKMPAAYGYIRRTEGADGDQFDVYLGPQPEAGTVFIVDQIDPKTGKFDEHKGLIGFVTQEEALRAYDGGFSDGSGPSRRGAVTAMPMDQFKDLVHNGDTTKALSYKQSTVAANDDATAEAAQRFALRRNIPVPPTNKQDNIRRGNRAIDSVIRDQADQPYAVHRPEIGWVDFVWGDEKAGIRHLLERRQSADKMSEQEAIAFAKRLPAAIVNGRLGAPYTTDGRSVKRNVMWNDQSIILQATRDGQKGHWVVTGFGGMKAMPERAKMLSKSEVEKMIADATAPGVKVRRDATHSIPNQGLRALQTNPPETAGGPRRSGISDEVGAASDNIIPDETVGNTTESQKNQRDADAERDGPATSRDEKGKPKGEESLRTPAAKEGGTAKYRLTPEFSRYRQSLAGDLQQRLRDVGIADRVSVRLVDSITDYDGSDTEAAGRYTRGLIDVAMGSGAESWVLNHEIVHALRDLDVIRKDEWSTLKRTALADQPRMAEVRERYADLNLTEEDLIEEAVADMFADYIDGTYQPKGFIRTAFTRIRAFIEALGNALRGNGFNSADAIFEAMDNGKLAQRNKPLEAETGEPAAAGVKFSKPRQERADTESKATATNRATLMLKSLGTQPVDTLIRVPFQIFGGLNQKNEWKPGLYISDKAGKIITDAKFTDDGRFAWLNPYLHKARAGLVDRYGLDEKYIERDRQRGLDERRITAEVPEIMERFKQSNLGPEEARVLQGILTGEGTGDDKLMKLSEPIRNAIDAFGAEAVQLGLLDAETFERNRGAYLHRVYLKHESDQGAVAQWLARLMGNSRKKIIGNQFKGRGLWMEVEPGRLSDTDSGDRVVILDQFAKAKEGSDAQPKLIRRVYLRPGQDRKDEYSGMTNRGTWEVRGRRNGKVILWRDFTKSEREHMGEVMDARYTVAKSYMTMAHDLATGRFYRDIAANEDWARLDEPTEGSWKEASEYSRFWADPEIQWVKVPDTKIKDSNTKRWGALSGRYIRAEIWRDISELDRMQRMGWWEPIMRQWKLNKTARSPVVHMNNVMSNALLMDMADVRSHDLAKAIHSMVKKDRHYKEAVEHGAFGSDMASIELQTNVLEPLLKEIQSEMTGGKGLLEGKIGLVGKLAERIFSVAGKADQAMLDAYRLEDEVFRLATYIRRRKQGLPAEQAAKEAVDQFLNYDIRAPWINMARRTALPFLAYTYRAVPLLAKTMMNRPWKMAKYVAAAHVINALGYALEPGDEDEERRSLREEEQGYTWLGTPRLLRMPFRDQHGNPMFLDIRRWIPAADVFDLNQSQSAIPLPSWITPGGPLMMAAELALNKQAFTGTEIVNDDTDDPWDKAGKIGSYLWKSWMPSAAWVPGSWYWDKIGNAAAGARDPSGRPYSIEDAVLNSVGIKLKPQDVEEGFERHAANFARVERELGAEANRDGRDLDRGLITQADYDKRMAKIDAKLDKIAEKADKILFGKKP